MTRIGPEPVKGMRVRVVEWYIDLNYAQWPTSEDGLIRDPQGAVVTSDDNRIVPPGTLGTVTAIFPGSVAVDWDNGSTLSLLDQGDDYVVLSEPEPS